MGHGQTTIKADLSIGGILRWQPESPQQHCRSCKEQSPLGATGHSLPIPGKNSDRQAIKLTPGAAKLVHLHIQPCTATTAQRTQCTGVKACQDCMHYAKLTSESVLCWYNCMLQALPTLKPSMLAILLLHVAHLDMKGKRLQ